MSVALPEAIAHYTLGIESFSHTRRSDPLQFYTGNGVGTDKLFSYLENPLVDEVWWVASNSGGKTFNVGAIVTGFAENKKYLDGRSIPSFGWGNVGWIITPSYKQQVDSSQKAVLEHLGEWPHDISWVDYGKGYIDTIYVAGEHCSHGHGVHCLRCSRMVFHCEMGKGEIGGRIDWAWIDEPCRYKTLDELRARRQAGRPFKRIGSATFLKRADWEWFVRDFEGCEDTPRPDLNRVWYRTEITDNNKLTAEDLRKFVADFSRSELRDARLRGLFVDVDTDCPLDITVLQLLMKNCVRGLDVPYIVKAQTMKQLRQVIAPTQATVEVWWEPEDEEDYIGIIDPSQGIKSVRRDPGAMHIYAVRTPRLVARYNGYIGAYGIGTLASRVGLEYNNARFDIDMTGGYGTATAAVMQELGYSNFFYETKPDRIQKLITQLGFKIHSTNRGEIISDLQEFCADPDIMVLCREVFESMMGMSIDHNGKIAAIEGSRHKDDDAVCLGRCRSHLKRPHFRQYRGTRRTQQHRGMEWAIAVEHHRTQEWTQEAGYEDPDVPPKDRGLDR